MKCYVCGERLEPTISDLPFRLGPTSIVVIKKLPVLECTNCTEFSIEDPVMEKVEGLLEGFPRLREGREHFLETVRQLTGPRNGAGA